MIENKKIKKLEKINKNSALRFKKNGLKPARAQTGVISRPAKTCDESNLFLLESDLVFSMHDDKVSFDISMLNHFKYITSAEIRKDLNEKIVTFLLESHQTTDSSSWQTVANDLAENENETMKGWSDSLKTFGGKYESFLKEYAALKKEASLQKKVFLYKMREQAAAKRLYLLSTYPAFEMRYRMRREEIKCNELCFNETFLREAGYTLENFTSAVLAEGLPQFFGQNSPAISTTLKNFMENYMINEVELAEQETELLMKTGYRKKISFQTVILVELSETDVILSLIFYMKSKSQPYGNYLKTPYSEDFLEILKKNDKEQEYLFNHYYGEKFQGLHSNTEKVCKIKELPLFE